jgi:radical SAM superfamily enzyme YgiQ (UPF0313 family)
LDYQRVLDEGGGENRFIFSRGCVFDCSYCSNKALSNLYGEAYFRFRSPQKAIEEISLDAAKYQFRHITFDDDAMSLNKDWFYDFFFLYKQQFKYPFGCNLRSGTFNADMVKLLKEAGATDAAMGVEHGNEKFRKTVLKRSRTNDQIIKDYDLLQQYGITGHAQIMTGLPFENPELFFDTVRLCRQLPIAPWSPIAIFQPYPGTELEEICRNHHWLPDKIFFREREEAVISYPDFSKKEIQLCHDVFLFLLRFKFIPLNFLSAGDFFLMKVLKPMMRLLNLIRPRTRLRLLVYYLSKSLSKAPLS